MRDLGLMTVFFSGQVTDILSTYTAINHFGQEEVNPVANELFQRLGMIEVMILKLFLTMFLLTLYVLTHYKLPLFKKPLEKSLQFGSLMIWLAGFINLSGIAIIVL